MKDPIKMADDIINGVNSQSVKTITFIKYQFPALIRDGKMYTLDGKTVVQYPIYYKYDNGNGSELSKAEIDYNFGFSKLIIEHEAEINEYKYQLNRLDTKFQACSNILERLRKSFWQYILFRFKVYA